MKIYRIEIQNGTATVVEQDYKDIDDIKYMRKYVGSKKNIITTLIELKYEDIDGNILLEVSEKNVFVNIPKGHGGWYLDNKAHGVLSDFFDESVELYHAKSHIEDYQLLYVKDVLKNSIEYTRSKIVWLSKEEKRAMMFEKYNFNEEIIKDKNIFRIQETGEDLYVSERFRQCCIDNNLTGIDFRLVYDSEDDSIEFPFEIV